MLAVTGAGVNQQSAYTGYVDPTEVLVDFLNTFDGEALATDEDARAWFAAHGLPADGLRAKDARCLRDALRSAFAGGDRCADDVAAVPLHAVPSGHGLELVSESPLGTLVATAVRLSYEGECTRLKICGLDTCRYAFYDESRNRSGRWCSMASCGNVAKSRAFRERHRAHG